MFIIKVVIEVALIALLIYGYTQEERIIAWERELFTVLRQYYRKEVRPYALCILRKETPKRRPRLYLH